MWRLLTPLRYFTLRNGEKTAIDITGTLIIGLLILLPFLLVPDASFFRSGGLLDRLIGLTSALTGFYVAALVAAATFAHPDLDVEMTVGAVQRPVRHDGETTWQSLTRRELVCAVFGYLSFASLLFSVSAAVLVPIATAAPGAPGWLHIDASSVLMNGRAAFRWIGMIVLAGMLAHIMTATGLGIYYLMERLHYRKPTVTTPAE
ncbi:MAG: hypothetical protein LCH57_12610 [Proteobacteria bacterium]|nr:hypothetical protein [Pseudomonadota bacterium]